MDVAVKSVHSPATVVSAAAADAAMSRIAALEHDVGILLITSLLPVGLVLITEILKDRNCLSAVQSRKFLHISTGPLFVLTWPMYTSSTTAR
jgi:phytol kinase